MARYSRKSSGSKGSCGWILLLWWSIRYWDGVTCFSTSSSTPNPSSSNVRHAVTTITVPPALDHTDGYPSPLHHIYITNILTPEEAHRCNTLSQTYAGQTGRWDTPDGIRHASYPTCDFPVDECPPMEAYLESIQFNQRMFGNLSQLYGIEQEDMEYLDLFVAHYQAKDSSTTDGGGGGMDRLELHRDGSLLSFSLLLNDPNDFQGGGTFYDALRDVPCTTILHDGGAIRPLQVGDACLHCGKLLHGADVVTSGFRTVLVGFVNVAERNIRSGVLSRACTNWGRMDVATFRNNRQLQKNQQGWTLSHGRGFFTQSKYPPYIKGYAPAFSSVGRRADPEYQRRKKLEAEDELLRQMLLSPDERQKDTWDGDSITIL